jgi:hypothetical protein
MSTPRPNEPHRAIFIALALVLAALLVALAISTIPSAERPTLATTTTAPSSSIS